MDAPNERQASEKCRCIFCVVLYPAIKRMREYLAPEDWDAIDSYLTSIATHEMDVEHETQKRREAEAERDKALEECERLKDALREIADTCEYFKRCQCGFTSPNE